MNNTTTTEPKSTDLTRIPDFISKLHIPVTLVFDTYQLFSDYIKTSTSDETGTVAHIKEGNSVPEVQQILDRRQRLFSDPTSDRFDISVIYIKTDTTWEMVRAHVSGNLETDGHISQSS